MIYNGPIVKLVHIRVRLEREVRGREREEKYDTYFVWLRKGISNKERSRRDPRSFGFFAQVRRKACDRSN